MKIKSLRNKGEGFVEVDPKNKGKKKEEHDVAALVKRVAALEKEVEAMKHV